MLKHPLLFETLLVLMVRSTSMLGLSHDLWYTLGVVLLVVVISAIAYCMASASQASVPPTAETFANTDKQCAANKADAHGCYPGKGEGWCAARGACINRMDAGLADDAAFAKQCDLSSSSTTEDDASAVAASTASTKTVTEVDTTVTTKSVETDTASAETTTTTEPERTDATGGTCCLGDSDDKDASAAAKCPSNATPASTAPVGDCATCGDSPPNNCPKPVYCPPCPKCPPPCPRMCPDLSKYVLKTSIPPCPEAQIDHTKYMLRSECKQPDMSKYVLKTSVPNFKCPPCPPCICKCDGSAYDPAVDGDGAVAREDARASDSASASNEAVTAEEALGGNRDSTQSSANFDNTNLTGEDGASGAGSSSGSGSSSGYGGSGYGGNGYGGNSLGGSGFGSLGGSSFGFGGGLFGRSSKGGGVGEHSASADFEGACAASDNDAYNGSYSVQPVIQD